MQSNTGVDLEEEKEGIVIEDSLEDDNGTAANGFSSPSRHQRIKQPSMLPALTPEIVEEHQAQKEAATTNSSGRLNAQGASTDSNAAVATPGFGKAGCCSCYQHDDQHMEPSTICGIPYYLFMILTALAAAVSAGTVLAVIYYDSSEGIQPPSPSPSAPLSPTVSPDGIGRYFR